MSFRKTLKRVAKVGAIAAATYFTGGAALTVLAKSRSQPAAPQGPQFVPIPYSAPFNPGFSYSGDNYGMGASGQVFGTGGAAVPISQAGGDGAPAGFKITPVLALGALIVLMLGFFLLRR